MDQRIYHGKINPQDLAQSLMSNFQRGNYRVQQVGSGDKLAVQIATTQAAASGGQTALSILIQKVEDGVSVQIGRQAWAGIAASIGKSAIAALINPWNLLNRIDDLAQDFESIQLSQEAWKVIEATARALGTGYDLSDRLRRSVCPYCGVANPVGEASCVGCGAPLGEAQPITCRFCGFVVKANERVCPNCGKPQ
jgi:hypothetical protein